MKLATVEIGSGLRVALIGPKPMGVCSRPASRSASISQSNTFCMQPMYVCPNSSNE